MTNYKLEEFKQWLNENKSRKENLEDWEKVFQETHDSNVAVNIFLGVKVNLHKEVYYHPYYQVFLKWKAELDQREREREQNQTLW